MVLAKSKVGFPFVKGVNTKVSDKTQAAGELKDCVNFSVNKVGRLDQRKGFRRLSRDIAGVGSSSSGTVDSAVALANLNDELLLLDGEKALSRTADDKWVKVDDCLNVRSGSTIVNTELQATSTNAAHGVSGGYEYIAWGEQPYSDDGIGADHGTGSDPVYLYMVKDMATGATVIPPTKIGSLSASYQYGGHASWTSAHPRTISLTGYPAEEISVGDFVYTSAWPSSEPKRLVTEVTTTGVTVSTDFPGNGTGVVLNVCKGSGQDALYFSPKIRVLCPPGTNHVLVLYQDGLELKYLYADTSSGTSGSLELSSKGVLETMGRPFPTWDADCLLSTNTSVTDSDGAAVAVVYYESASPYSSQSKNLRLKLYNVSGAGALSSYASTDAPTNSAGWDTPAVRRSSSGGFVTDLSRVWQPFLKVAHDEYNGVPQASRDSDIVLGFSALGGEFGDKLLLHMQGNVADSSGEGRDGTASSELTYTTSGAGGDGASGFGSAAVFNNGGTYSLDDAAKITFSDIALGTGDLTIEFWWYYGGTSGIAQGSQKNAFLSTDSGATALGGFEIRHLDPTNFELIQIYQWDGTAEETLDLSPGQLTYNNWYHIAIVRESGDFRLYIGAAGDETGSYVDGVTGTARQWGGEGDDIHIGQLRGGAADGTAWFQYHLDGVLDEFAISSGVKYSGTGSYDLPVSPHIGKPQTRVMAFDDDGGLSWDKDLVDSSFSGPESGWILSRGGVGYDASSIYVMAEMHSDVGATSTPVFEPQRHAVLSSKFARSDGSQSAGETRALWSNSSVHSDGFISSGNCYFWLTAAQGVDRANAITYLADTKGRIHGHGVYGAPSLCASLEYLQQVGEGTTTKMTSRVQRNMSGLASRVTPLRWSESGSSKYLAGSSTLGFGSKFYEYNLFSPSVLNWDTSPDRPFRSVQAYGALYLCGGLLWSYDGSRLVEADFLLSPAISQGGNITGGVMPPGDYGYYVAYEYRDDNNKLHSSRPVLYESNVKNNGDDPTFKIRLNQLTNHRYSPDAGNPATYSIAIYRTNTDGDIFYLHKVIGYNDWGVEFAPSDSQGDRIVEVSYTDSDATQHSATDTQVLVWGSIGPENAGGPVSSPIDIVRHKDCLLVSNTENVLYSSMGLSSIISPVFPQTVGEDAGKYGLKGDGVDSPITHIATNGQTFVFFTSDNGYAAGGEGPDMFGEGTWSRPEKVAPGQGVRPGGFMASTPVGVLYSSINGIAAISKDLSLANFGAPIDDYSTIAAANSPMVLDSSSEVWIPLSGGSGRGVIVYNYLTNSWYRHEIGSEEFHPGGNVDSVSWIDSGGSEVVYIVDSSGYVYRQKTDSDSDPYIDKVGSSGTGYPITSELKTGWIQVPGYGERVRCYRIAVLGTWLGATGTTALTVSTSTNFNNASVNEQHSVDITDTGVGAESTGDGGSQVLLKPKSQKMEALSVKISTVTTSTGSVSGGWSLEGLLLEIGKRPEKTRFKQGAARTVAAT